MKYYFAPMEGITGYIHRNAFQKFFPGTDKYFTAFIAPNQKGKFSARERGDILPEHNEGMYVVPQLLTNDAEDFVETAERIAQFGYEEVNLNLGCPSKTVVSKYRGSGFLEKPDMLDAFFEELFAKRDRRLPGMRISVKTRLGRYERDEFPRLLEIYSRYPLEELIIHPRTQQDFYGNRVDMEMYAHAVRSCEHPLCFNGDIVTGEDYRAFVEKFPESDRVMIGRGFLRNPGLLDTIRGGGLPGRERLKAFHDCIYEAYKEEMSGGRPTLFKMKELWFYMGDLFPGCEKLLKKIRKAEKLPAYEDAVERLFERYPESEGESGL